MLTLGFLLRGSEGCRGLYSSERPRGLSHGVWTGEKIEGHWLIRLRGGMSSDWIYFVDERKSR